LDLVFVSTHAFILKRRNHPIGARIVYLLLHHHHRHDHHDDRGHHSMMLGLIWTQRLLHRS
jgi:hypothetical protein